MHSTVITVLIVLYCVLCGGLIGYSITAEIRGLIIPAAIGLCFGILCAVLLRRWLRATPYSVIGGTVGIVVGLGIAGLVHPNIAGYIENPTTSIIVYCSIVFLACLFGLQLGASKADEIAKRMTPGPHTRDQVIGILDTSVIIDGRIADICETGFLEGDLVIPQFVLRELQAIADSSESTKRTRGRRGLDILKKIQKQSFINVIIDDTDYPSLKEVDQKLINMAKESGYSILTNDYNLNKVAEVHSIKVLNINQLANALKPVVLPGETIKVHVMREGKEHGQGVAYLDDGTMVVIDNGRRFMGREIDVTVTSVLQTTAGRMIFAAGRN